MAAELTWLEDEIILCTFSGEFDFENYGVMEGQLPMMVREKDQRVDAILYLSVGASLPNLRGILQEIGIIVNVMPPNFGLFIGFADHLLLSNPVSILLARMFLPIYDDEMSKRVNVAVSIEAAQAIIRRDRDRK